MQTEILNTKSIFEATSPSGRTWLSVHEREVRRGSVFPYFFVTRGKEPNADKPDAVVIVATTEGDEPRLVLTNEFRPPINRREIAFPAGLIDPKDLEQAGGDVIEAVKLAAIRELKEETNLDLVVTEVSPETLYSSAGLTDESVCYVFGKATGQQSVENCEEGEDITLVDVTHAELCILLNDTPDVVFAKSTWPLLWAFARWGFPW